MINVPYRISPSVRVIQRGDEFAVYNSLRAGSLLFLNSETKQFLDEFVTPVTFEEISQQYKEDEAQEVFTFLVDSQLIIQDGVDERLLLGKQINLHRNKVEAGKCLSGIVLEITKYCNFGCSYCFASLLSESGTREKTSHMSLGVAKKAVYELFSNAVKNGLTQVEVAFLGGEPLVNWPVLAETVQYSNSLSQQLGVSVVFSVTTNGSLVTDTRAQFLIEHGFRVSVSLDGPPEENDLTRFYPNKRGTYKDIVDGITRLVHAGVDVTVLTTLSDKNFDGINSTFIHQLKAMGINNWGINLEDMASMLNDDIERIVKKLVSLCREALDCGINTAGMWFKPIYAMTKSRLAYCSSAEGASISVEPSGAIYVCSRTAKPIGHVERFSELFKEPGYISASMNIVGNILSCRGCDLEGLCLGGCMATSESSKSCMDCSLTGRNELACRFVNKIVHAVVSDPSLPLMV